MSLMLPCHPQCSIPAMFATGDSDTFVQPHHAHDLYQKYAGDKAATHMPRVEGDESVLGKACADSLRSASPFGRPPVSGSLLCSEIVGIRNLTLKCSLIKLQFREPPKKHFALILHAHLSMQQMVEFPGDHHSQVRSSTSTCTTLSLLGTMTCS